MVKEKGRRYVLTADISQFEAAFSKANAVVRESAKQMRALGKALKFDSTNLNALKMQLEMLGKSARATQTKIASLKKQIDELERLRSRAAKGDVQAAADYNTLGGEKKLNALKVKLIEVENEYQKLQKTASATAKAISNNDFDKSMNQLNSELTEATAKSKALANALKLDGNNLGAMKGLLSSVNSQIDISTNKAKLLERQIAKLNSLRGSALGGSEKAGELFNTAGGVQELERLQSELLETKAAINSFKNEARTLDDALLNNRFNSIMERTSQEIKQATANARELAQALDFDGNDIGALRTQFFNVNRAIESTSEQLEALQRQFAMLQRLKNQAMAGDANAARMFDVSGGIAQLESLENKIVTATSRLKQFKQQASTLDDAIKNNGMNVAFDKLNQEIEEATANVKQLSAAMNMKGFNSGDASLRFRELNRVIEQTEQKIRLLNQQRVNVKVNSQEFIKLTNEINKAEMEVKELIASMTALERFQVGGLRGLTGGMEGFTTGVQNASRFARQKGMEMTMSLTAPGAYMASSLMRGYMDSEKYIKRAAGAASNGGEAFQANYDQIKALSKEMSGLVPTLDYGQTAKGIEQIIKGGVKLETILGGKNSKQTKAGVASIMQLADLEEMDVGVAAESVLNTLNQFNMGFEKASYVTDMLKAASDASTVSVGDLMETLKYTGPVAGTFGSSLKDTALATTFMAKAGIKGSMAGTAMRSMFTALTENATKTHGELSKYGVAVLDSSGKTRPLVDILADLSGAMEHMTETEKLAAVEALVGKNALSGVAEVAGMTKEEIRALDKEFGNVEGSVSRMYQKMLEGSDGRIAKGITDIKNSMLELGEQLAPAVADVVETVAKLVNWFKNLSPEAKSAMVKVGAAVLALGPALTLFGWATAPIKGLFNAFKWGKEVIKGLKFGKAAKELADVGNAADKAGDMFDRSGKRIDKSAGRMRRSTGGLGASIGNAFRGMGQGIGQVFRGAFDGISRIITASARGLSTVIKGIGTGLKSAFQGVGQAAKGIGTGIKSALQGVGTVIESIGKSIGFAARGIGEGLRAMFMGVALVNPATMLAFAAAILAVGAAITLVLTQSDGIVAIIKQIGDSASQMVDTMANAFIRATPSIVTLINTIRDAIMQVIPVVVNGITQIIGAVANAAPQIAGAIATVVGAIAGGVSQIIGSLSGLVGSISGLVNSIAGVISAAGGAIKAVLDGIGNAFTGFGNGVRLALEGVGTVVESTGSAIKSGLEGVADVIESVGNAIKSALEGAADIIRSVGESAEKAGNGFRLFSEGMKQLSDIGALSIGATLASVADGISDINDEKDDIQTTAENIGKLKTAMGEMGNSGGVFSSAITSAGQGLDAFKTNVESVPTAIKSIAEGFTSFGSSITQMLSSLTQAGSQVQQFTQGIVQAMTGLTAGAVAITAFNTSIMMLGTGLMMAGTAVTMFGAAMTMMTASLTMASAAMTMFSAAFTAMTASITAANSIITMLVASITQLSAQLTTVGASAMTVTASLTAVVASMTMLTATTTAAGASMMMFGTSLMTLTAGLTGASMGVTAFGMAMTMMTASLTMAGGAMTMFSASFMAVNMALSTASMTVSSLGMSLSSLAMQFTTVSAAATSVAASITAMTATFTASFATITAATASAFAAMVAATTAGMAAMTAAVSAGTAAMIGIMQNFASQMQALGLQAGTNAAQSTAQGLSAGTGTVSAAGMGVLNAARGAMMGVSFFSVGSSITQGIAAGINSGWGYLIGLVSSLASSLLAAAKSALNINSPSREFRDDVGRWIPSGIGVGVDRYKEIAIRSVRNMARATLNAAKGLNIAGKINDTFSSTLATNTRVEHSVRQNAAVVDGINTLIDRINNLELKSDVYMSTEKVGQITYREHQNIERRLAY